MASAAGDSAPCPSSSSPRGPEDALMQEVYTTVFECLKAGHAAFLERERSKPAVKPTVRCVGVRGSAWECVGVVLRRQYAWHVGPPPLALRAHSSGAPQLSNVCTNQSIILLKLCWNEACPLRPCPPWYGAMSLLCTHFCSLRCSCTTLRPPLVCPPSSWPPTTMTSPSPTTAAADATCATCVAATGPLAGAAPCAAGISVTLVSQRYGTVLAVRLRVHTPARERVSATRQEPLALR